MYYAIQDRNIGFIQYLGEAIDKTEALQKFDADVGIDPHETGIDPDDWVITELTAEQYAFLDPYAGTDQEAIDYLSRVQGYGAADAS